MNSQSDIVNKAKTLAREDQYAAAILECERYFRSSQSEPVEARAAMQRHYGYCFLMTQDYRRAIEELKKVLAMQGVDRETLHLAYSNMGNAYERMRNRNEALQNYQESLKYADSLGDRQIVEMFIRYLPY